jgi:hypothetical protein
VAIEGDKLEKSAEPEDDCRREQAREKLSNYQNFSAQRRQEIVVQALLHHLASEQVDEDSHTAEKDGDPEIEELEYGGKSVGILAKIAWPPGLQLNEGMEGVEQHRGESQKVNPEPAPGEEGLSHLEAKDGQNLRSPERPWKPPQAHFVDSSVPIKYS